MYSLLHPTQRYSQSRILPAFFWITCICFLANSSAFGQSYYYLIGHGISDDYYPFGSNGTEILSSPLNDVFSTTQTIPFSWDFYGSPVTGYKASDNGYITFDLSAATSDPSNTSIPGAATPNDAIYAFWDNLELSNTPSFITNEIRTYTVGTTPNRVHVIQWNVTPLGKQANANYLYFAVRLYEQGDFDIIFQQIKLGSGTFVSATVGCEDSAGTDGTMVSGSPNFTYTGGAYIKENIAVYSFIYGSQPAYDIELAKLDIPEVLATDTTYPIMGSIVNHGTQTITSLMIDYQIDNNPVKSATLSSLNIATNESYDFTHPDLWSPANVGKYEEVVVWVSKINANNDMNPGDDTLSHRAYVNMGISATKKVLIEEFSTAPCGFCPRGSTTLEDIMASHENVIGMTHHSAYQSDSMTIPESVAIAAEFATGAPTGCVDRMLWPGEIKVAVSTYDWEDHSINRLSQNAPVAVAISNSWDPSTRDLEITVDLEFLDYAHPGDMRITVYIIEDSVSKIGPGYDQTNYYNNTPSSPFYGLGDPIIGYIHRHVIRAVPTTTWGEAGAIPDSVLPGEQVTRNYYYKIPARFNEDQISMIAFVSYYDGERREILNANKKENIYTISTTDVLIKPFQINIYPNPFNDQTTIAIENPNNEKYVLTLTDITGRLVQKMVIDQSVVHLSKENLPAGIYILSLEGEKVIRRKIIVE